MWGLALALSLMLPRAAEACDPGCATFERGVGTVVVGLPTALLTGFIAPAIGKGFTHGRKDAPSYGAGLGYSLLGATAGVGVALASHALMFPDSRYGLDGSGMSLPVALAYFSIPPALGGAVASYLTYRDESPLQEPSVSVLLAPSPSGLSLAVGGRF